MGTDDIAALKDCIGNSHTESVRIGSLMKKMFAQQLVEVANFTATMKLCESTATALTKAALMTEFINLDGTINYKGVGGYEQALQNASDAIVRAEALAGAAAAAAAADVRM